MTNEHDIWQWQEPDTAWKGAGLYHITLTIPSREPLLGTLVIPDADASKAKVEILPLGKAVLNIQRQLSSFYPEIQILHYCLMPDHLHAIWYVRQAMPRGIRAAVRGFWQEVKKVGRLSSFAPNLIRENYQERAKTLREEIGADRYDALPPIFTEMPFVRPMGQRRQLPATLRYIDMNPQRLATKRLMPGFFRVQEGIELGKPMFTAHGVEDAAKIAAWLRSLAADGVTGSVSANGIELCIGGPRASECTEGYRVTMEILEKVLEELG